MSKSPLDDSLTVALSIAATSGPSNSIGGTQSSRLIIRCQEHSTEFYIALDEYLGSGSAEKQDSTGEPKWVPNFVRDGEVETPKLPPERRAPLPVLLSDIPPGGAPFSTTSSRISPR